MPIIRNMSARIVAAISFFVLAFAFPAMAAPHLRGTVEAFKDGAIAVKTAKGDTQEIKVDATTPLFLVTKSDLSAVNAGKFVGVTSVEKDGKRIAKEVHIFANTLRGLGEGHYPWDLEGDPNMMTNANIATVNSVGADRVLKLEYKGGEQMIDVPESASIVAFDPCKADQLVAGRKVFVIPGKEPNTAAAIVIGAEGIKPPM